MDYHPLVLLVPSALFWLEVKDSILIIETLKLFLQDSGINKNVC